MGSFCGTASQTVVNTASNPNVTNQQNAIYGLVNQYANQFGQNPSSLVAPWNSMETSAAQGISDNTTSNQPYNYIGQGEIGQAADITSQAPSLYGQAASTIGSVNPIASTAWNPTAYESPYTQDVINSTMANINEQNAVQQNGALGQAIASGNAFGGDRAGIAQGQLAYLQDLASQQTLTGLEQANFNQASQQANAQQQYGLNLGQANNAQTLQAGSLYGNLGSGLTQAGAGLGNLGYQTGNLSDLAQQSTLGAYQGLYNTGTGLQNTQQQQLSAPLTFGSWYGSASPGTGTVPTSTTYPGSNPASTIASLGLTGLLGASALSNLGAFGAVGALAAARGGRIGKHDGGGATAHHDDLLERYHHIKKAVGGGAQQIEGNIETSQNNPVVQAAQLRRRMLEMSGQYAPSVATSSDFSESAPLSGQDLTGLIQPTSSASGGRIHRQHFDVGGTPDDPTNLSQTPSIGNMGSDNGGMGTLTQQDKLKAIKKLLDASHALTQTPTLSIPGLKPQPASGQIAPPMGGGSSPTTAPTAPGTQTSQLPQQAMGVLNFQKQGNQQQAALDNQQDILDDAADGTLFAESSGGSVHRGHYDEGGSAPSVDDQAAQDAYQDAQDDAADDAAASSSSPGARQGAYQPQPGTFSSLYRSPLLMMLSTLSHLGERDAHGLPKSPFATAATGLGEYLQQGAKNEQEDRDRQLRALQIAQQAQIAQGMINGKPTLAAIQQAENIRRENNPQWVPGAGGRDFYGNPIGGWVQPNMAPSSVQYTSPNSTNMPGYSGAAPSASAPAPTPPPSADTSGATAPDPNAPPNTTRIAPGVFVPKTISAPDEDLINLQGQDFLNALSQRHPQEANVVKGILGGLIPPSDPRVRGMQGQHYLAWAQQADPNFNAATWPLRLQAQKAVAPGGKIAAQNASAGMLIGHLSGLYDMVDSLGNWDYVPTTLRKVVANPFAREFETGPTGTGTALSNFENQAGLVAREKTKLLAGPGGGTLEETNRNLEDFAPNKSGSTLKATIKNTIDQMDQRLMEGAAQYNQVMGTNKGPRDFMAPEHRAMLERLEQKLGVRGNNPQGTGPSPEAINFLREHASDPNVIKQFEQKYGVSAQKFFLQ